MSVSGRPNEPDSSSALQARLKNLERGSNQQSSMHSVLRDRYATANFYLTLGSLIPTAGLLCLSLVSDQFAQSAMGLTPDHFKIFNAAVALFAFVCILIQLVWKPDSRSDAHARAVDHYANAKYDAKNLLDSTAPLEPMAVRLVEEKYLDKRGLPPIPDAKFNWLKQRHLRKVDISKRLDKDPWMSLPRWPWNRPKSATPGKGDAAGVQESAVSQGINGENAAAGTQNGENLPEP